MQLTWCKEDGEEQAELVPMTELCTRFTNIATANLLLFQAVFYDGVSRSVIRKISAPANENSMALLNERPGLQRITYSAKYDSGNFQKQLPQILEKALQQKDPNVNIVNDLLLELTTVTPLFRGQKNFSIMKDNRSKDQFANIKANFDSCELTVQIFA